MSAKTEVTKAPQKDEQTGLSLVSKDRFLAVSQSDPDLLEAMKALEDIGEEIGVEDLIRVKTPTGGGTTWEIDGATTEHTEEIVGALIHVQKHGVLWPKEDPEEGVPPVLKTYDLATAQRVGEIPDEMAEVLAKYQIGPDMYDWASLPYNKFGSGKDGGKRCREQRLLFVLRPDDSYPLLVPINPGSLAKFRKFIKDVASKKIPYWRAVISLKLEKTKSRGGKPYSRVVPSLVGVLSKEDGDFIKEKYTEAIKEQIRELDLTPMETEEE